MTKQVTVKQDDNTLPAFLQQSEAPRGSEEISSNDLSIPRIQLIQGLSPQKKKSHAKYIEGAEEGMAYNTLTNELYSNKIVICPVYFRKEYLVWPKIRNADSGSEFKGAFPSLEAALNCIKEIPNGTDEYHPVETHQHFVLAFNADTDTWEPAVIAMSSSQIKVSKQLNSILQQRCASLKIDRFGNKVDLKIIEEKNSKGEFYNYKPSFSGFVDEETFKLAEQFYNGVKSGEREVNYKDVETSHDEKKVSPSSHPEENLEEGEFPEGM